MSAEIVFRTQSKKTRTASTKTNGIMAMALLQV